MLMSKEKKVLKITCVKDLDDEWNYSFVNAVTSART